MRGHQDYNRGDRIGEAIKRVISQALLAEIRDPQLPPLAVVTRVKMAKDCSHATVFVNSSGPTGEKDDLLEVLNRAKGFLRTKIAHELALRKTPSLSFRLDEAADKGLKTMQFIDEVLAQDRARAKARGGDFDAETQGVVDATAQTKTPGVDAGAIDIDSLGLYAEDWDDESVETPGLIGDEESES